MSRVDEVIRDVIGREGSKFVNHPNDRGRATRYGVTQAVLSSWRGKPVSEDDVRALTFDEAATLYREMYVDRPGFDYIKDEALLGLVVDCAVHHGTRQATKFLQRAVGVDDDGVLGPLTRRAIDGADTKRVYLRICAHRARFFGRILTDRPLNSPFAAGWMNRLAGFIDQAAS